VKDVDLTITKIAIMLTFKMKMIHVTPSGTQTAKVILVLLSGENVFIKMAIALDQQYTTETLTMINVTYNQTHRRGVVSIDNAPKLHP